MVNGKGREYCAYLERRAHVRQIVGSRAVAANKRTRIVLRRSHDIHKGLLAF